MSSPVEIDIRTVIFMVFVGNLVTIFILLAYRSNSIPRRPYIQFLCGKVLQTAAWLLLGLRGTIDLFYSLYLGNAILFSGFALESIALITINATSRRWEIAYLLITVFSILFFGVFSSTANLAVVLASMVTAVIYGTASILLWSGKDGSRLSRTLGIFYSLFCMMMLYRAVFAWTHQDFYLLSGNGVESLTFVLLFLLMMVSVFSFSLLLRERNDRLLAQAYHELGLLARVDSLTQLSNRRAFDEALFHAVQGARRRGEPLSLIMMDIDWFKNYNDLYGHIAGDDCLKKIGGALLKCRRRGMDIIARYGGEEFAMILPDTDNPGALVVAEIIRAAVYHLDIPHPASETSERITVSLGVFTAIPSSDAEDEDWFITEADRLLYSAKQLGRNRSVAGEKVQDPAWAAGPGLPSSPPPQSST